jgi:stress response protein SCP2
MSQDLAKGQNLPVPTAVVHAVLSWNPAADTPDVDVSALLLSEAGRVRSDADFIFYNQPTHDSGAMRHAGKQHADGGSSDALTVLLGSVEPAVDRVVLAASADGPFGRVPDLVLCLFDGAHTELARFAVRGEGSETSMVAGELYRRDGGWRFRAVGQGFDDGLAGLATAYGIDVSKPGAARPVVNLDKGTVSLRKNETVSLVKTGAPPLSTVRMGLGWDPAKASRSVDLDASVIAFAGGRQTASVSFLGLRAFDGALKHGGDNLTGRGDGDDEHIIVALDQLPAEVDALVFTVNSYRGHVFTDVGRAYCRLLDETTGAELVRFELTDSAPNTGVIMAALLRGPTPHWTMRAIGAFHDGRTVDDMITPAKALLADLT